MRCTAVVTILALTSVTGTAQAQVDSVRLERLQARVNSQDRVRILTEWGRIELYDPRLTDEAITYARAQFARSLSGAVPAFPQPLPLSRVSQIQVRGSAAGSGAIIGASVLGGLVLLVGIGAAAEGGWFAPSAGEVVRATVVFAGIGALIGAAIGAGSGKWKTVYRAP